MLSVIIRSVVVILIGVLLVFQRDTIMPVIVQCIGAAFILPGIVAIASLFITADNKKNVLVWPTAVTAVGSVALGLWMLFSPLFFVALIMNILGVLLLLLGLYQIFVLVVSKKHCAVSFAFFVMPLLLVLLGGFVLAKPFGAASLPFLFIGIGAIIGGISDILSYMIIRRSNRNKQQEETEVEIIDKKS